MGVSPAQYGPDKGPFYALWGNNKRPMANLNVTISVDKDGVFQGVLNAGFLNGVPKITFMTIPQWNQQFEQTQAY